MKNYLKTFLVAITLAPTIAFAATFKDLVASVVDLGKLLMPLLFSIALVLFIWGITDFIRNADNPDQRKKGKSRMFWGILALTVMVGYLGFTSVFTNTFFGDDASILPQLFDGR